MLKQMFCILNTNQHKANSINVKKGGRPKKSNKTERFFEKPKKAYNDNVNDNDNVNVNDNENENENENENDTLTKCEYNIKHTPGEERKNQTSVLEKERQRGNYGFAALTDEAFSRLKEKYGENEVFRQRISCVLRAENKL